MKGVKPVLVQIPALLHNSFRQNTFVARLRDAEVPKRSLALAKHLEVMRVQVIEFSSTQNKDNRTNHEQFPLQTVAPLISRVSSRTKWIASDKKFACFEVISIVLDIARKGILRMILWPVP